MFSKTVRIVLLLVVTLPTFSQSPLAPQQEQKKEYTPEEKAKLKQAEEFAEKFVKRWHETLDLNVLLEEMFVADEGLRGKVESEFGFFIDDWNEEIDERFHKYAVKIIGKDRAKNASIAYLNLIFLSLELKLFYTEQEINRIPSILDDVQFDKLSKSLFDWFQKQKSIDPGFQQKVSEDEAGRIRQIVNKFIESFNYQIALYRAKLPREFFLAEKYKSNLKMEHGDGSSEIVSSDDSLYEALKVKKGQQIYEVERGVFLLLITEVYGQFKILSFK